MGPAEGDCEGVIELDEVPLLLRDPLAEMLCVGDVYCDADCEGDGTWLGVWVRVLVCVAVGETCESKHSPVVPCTKRPCESRVMFCDNVEGTS